MADESVPQASSGFKVCKACGKTKPLEEFRVEPRVKDGRTSRCRLCLLEENRAYARAHPDRIKASREKYAARFPERVQAARAYTNRRLSLERREARIATGKPLLEPRVTNEGRLCSRCRRRKPVEEFPPNRKEKDGVSCYCRECRNVDAIKRQRAANAEQREARRRYARKYDIARLYGISLESALALQESQGGRCRICCDAIDIMAQRSGGIDHCHATGRIRGILCIKCNAGIGQFRDRPDLLRAAADYLEIVDEVVSLPPCEPRTSSD